jgi:Hemerythrin HHE cation binding domain
MSEEPLANPIDMAPVHVMFRREFRSLPGLVRAVAAGDLARATVVADHAAFVDLVLTIHHTGEDKHVWPLLHERVPAEIEDLVDVMEEQHAGVHEEHLRLGGALAAWRDGASAADREAVAESLERLVARLAEHLALEEERVVPLIGKYLTAAEWARLAEDGAVGLSPDELLASVGMIFYEADQAVIDMIIGHMPAEIRPAFPKAANDAYAAYAERVYGTPAPPRGLGGR